MNVKKRKKSDAPIFVAGGLIVIVSIVVFILLLTRDKGFFVDVVNPNGVSKGSPVIWQNACVGSVKKVREENGRFNIGFVLFSGFKKKVHADVKACPIKQSDTKNAVLLLVGGKDEAKPFLTAGSQIPAITEGELPLAQLKDKYTDLRNSKGLNEIVGWIMLVLVVCIGYKFIRGKGTKGFPFLSLPDIVRSGKRERFSPGYKTGLGATCCCDTCPGDLMGEGR